MSEPAVRTNRSLWRHVDFMKLWTGETVSQLGTQVTQLALPLAAILVLKASAFQVGLLAALEFLPFILFGLPAGVWVDRLRRRPVLIAGDVLRVLTLGSIPVAYKLGTLHIGQLYAVAFLTGIGTVFFDVAYQSYLPALVERDQLVDGNAKLEMSRSAAQLGGPALGGFLVQLFKAPVAIAADAVSYVWSAAFIVFIRRPEPPIDTRGADGKHPKMRSEIAEGWRYVWRHALLRPIAFCTATANLFGQMIFALFVLFAVRSLHLKAGQIGLLFSLGSVGALIGAMVVRRSAERLGVGPAIIGSIFVSSLAALLIPATPRSLALPMLLTAQFFFGFGAVIYNSNQVGLRQAITPARMQGRMNATMRFMVWGTIPIGSFVGGILGNTIGIRTTMWIGAIGGLLAVVPPLLSPVRRLERIPALPEESVGEALAAGHDGLLVDHAPEV